MFLFFFFFFLGRLPTHGHESSREWYQNAVGNSEFSWYTALIRAKLQGTRESRSSSCRIPTAATLGGSQSPSGQIVNARERVGAGADTGADENPEGGFSPCTSKGKTCLRCSKRPAFILRHTALCLPTYTAFCFVGHGPVPGRFIPRRRLICLFQLCA